MEESAGCNSCTFLGVQDSWGKGCPYFNFLSPAKMHLPLLMLAPLFFLFIDGNSGIDNTMSGKMEQMIHLAF